MRRRDFIKGVVGSAIAWPIPALAQSPVALVGFLNSASSDGFGERITAFKHGLQQTGYIADQNVKIEYRWAEGHFDRLPLMADELVKRRVDVIAATGSSNSALAARAATATIPIVFTTGGDPVADGLVTNLSRPGGNVTGMTNFSNAVLPKRLGLIRELLPSAALIAVLVNPSNTSTASDIKNLQQAERPSGQNIVIAHASTEREINSAFESLVQKGVGALVLDADGFFRSRAEQLVSLAGRYLLPTIYSDREYAFAGGLMSYGPSIVDGYRQCGVYSGAILKGAKPGDLPILQPTKFDFVLNFKTAKTLGITFPSGLLSIADEVIE
jgi:putative ABC transport system substrate-binding protein